MTTLTTAAKETTVSGNGQFFTIHFDFVFIRKRNAHTVSRQFVQFAHHIASNGHFVESYLFTPL